MSLIKNYSFFQTSDSQMKKLYKYFNITLFLLMNSISFILYFKKNKTLFILYSKNGSKQQKIGNNFITNKWRELNVTK